MKLVWGLICAFCFCSDASRAESAVTLTVGSPAHAAFVPADFSGLSFETMLALPDARGQHIFSRTNAPLIALFKTLGVHSLRIGGNTADLPSVAVPTTKDIDNLFAFAKAAHIKVIYTLRLRNGDLAGDVDIASYIATNYGLSLKCFAIGNEPDYYRKVYPAIGTYPEFREEWKKYVTTIFASNPSAEFCGPCTGGAPVWTHDFADDFAKTGLLAIVTQHDYPGGSSKRATNAAAARDKMLSAAWLDHYQKFYEAFATTAISNGLAYRIEEASNFSDGGVKDASDTFAAALWSLDYLYWWAAHGADGVNLHGRRWVPNCVIYPVSGKGRYNVRPVGYGIKAFDLGAHGVIQSLAILNPDSVNLTAYAVRDGRHAYVTIVNKEHGPGARPAAVTIADTKMPKTVSIIYLTAPEGDISAKSGITLGGASIEDDSSWRGKWTTVAAASVKVPAASAAVIRY